MSNLFRLSLVATLLFSTAAFALAQDPTPTPSPTPEAAASPQPEATPEPEVAPTTTPEPTPIAAKPVIYFYRIKQFAGSALEPSVFCDDKELARMDNGRYFGVTLDPGKHTCRMGDKQTGFELDMKAGEEYYAKITLEAGFWKGHGRLTLLQKEQGAFEMKNVKPLGADKVKNRALVTIFEGNEKKP